MLSLKDEGYNPDVLSCLANLSNDEVFTPPEIANKMLDLLPQEIFRDPTTTFLDPACKSGVFLREIARRLIVGLQPKIPDLQERLDHIFHKQLFGIAITQLTSLLARRTLYCSKFPNGRYSVSKFASAEGNIRFRATQHKWKDGRCEYCGASEREYARDASLETHAYEFIHVKDPQEIFKMDRPFTVIIGNPPYQLDDGGAGASARPIYHLFVEAAKKLNPQHLVMIIPARWYSGGKGLDSFREEMLNDGRIVQLVDIANSADCFPGVNIAGGVCYFLWGREVQRDCFVANFSQGKIVSQMRRPLDEFRTFVRDNRAIDIIHKVLERSKQQMDSVVSSRNRFGLCSDERGHSQKKPNDLKLLSSDGYSFIEKAKISDKSGYANKYKVVITYAMSGGNKPGSDGKYQIISSLLILGRGEVCTETYLVLGAFNRKEEAENLVSYLKTRFARFLLLQMLSSIHITKSCFAFVPLQDFSRAWSDEELYEKYGLTEEERAFIESMIREMR